MIVPRINRHFFSNVITGVESILNPAGYTLIICQSEERYEKEIENVETLIANRVGGILISISVETHEVKHLHKAINAHIPIVMFDRVSNKMNVNKVENDDEAGSYETAIHLIEQGYKDFLWMGGPRTSSIYRNRFNGYKKALEENNIDLNKMKCFEATPVLQVAYNYMKELIDNKNIPEVVFATSDYMAMGVLQACQDNGVKVPEDIAVTGYSNEPLQNLYTQN